MCTGVKMSGPRELEIQTVLSCLVGDGLNLGPFGKTVSALNHWSISQSLRIFLMLYLPCVSLKQSPKSRKVLVKGISVPILTVWPSLCLT